MIEEVKLVEIDAGATPIARVVCEAPVDLYAEKRLRKMLDNFYVHEKPVFSRIALQAVGTVILFRTIQNGKIPPTNEDLKRVMVALNLTLKPATSVPVSPKVSKPKSVIRHKV